MRAEKFQAAAPTFPPRDVLSDCSRHGQIPRSLSGFSGKQKGGAVELLSGSNHKLEAYHERGLIRSILSPRGSVDGAIGAQWGGVGGHGVP